MSKIAVNNFSYKCDVGVGLSTVMFVFADIQVRKDNIGKISEHCFSLIVYEMNICV